MDACHRRTSPGAELMDATRVPWLLQATLRAVCEEVATLDAQIRAVEQQSARVTDIQRLPSGPPLRQLRGTDGPIPQSSGALGTYAPTPPPPRWLTTRAILLRLTECFDYLTEDVFDQGSAIDDFYKIGIS
jgi:hypothetical protein